MGISLFKPSRKGTGQKYVRAAAPDTRSAGSVIKGGSYEGEGEKEMGGLGIDSCDGPYNAAGERDASVCGGRQRLCRIL